MTNAVVTNAVVTNAVVTNAVVTNAVVTNAVVTNAVVTQHRVVASGLWELGELQHLQPIPLPLSSQCRRPMLSNRFQIVRPSLLSVRSSVRVSARLVPWITGAVVIVLGSTVLFGWALAMPLVQNVQPGLVAMQVKTALGLVLAAVALLLDTAPGSSHRRRDVGIVLATLVALLGAATLWQSVTGVALGPDALISRAGGETGSAGVPDGRLHPIAPLGALVLLLVGCSLLCLQSPRARLRRLSPPLALTVGALALAGVFGYLYGVIPPVRPDDGPDVPAVAGFLLLTLGLLARHLDADSKSILLSEQSAGMLSRRLLPLALILPLVLGVLLHVGRRIGFGPVIGESATIAAVTMIVFGVMSWRAAQTVDETDRRWRETEQRRFSETISEESARARLEAEQLGRAVAEQAGDAAERARQVAEEAVRQKDDASALLNLVLDHAPLGIAILDRDLRFRRVNSALAAIVGLSAEAYAGRTLRELLPARADIEPLLRGVMATGRPIMDMPRQGDVDPTSRQHRQWLLSAFPLRVLDGEVIGVGVTLVDTTERNRLESQLRQAQKMEAVGQLAGGVAHDFNNVLTVVTSYSSMLLADLDAEDPMSEDLREIERAAARAADLTRQLLAFSRQQVLQPQIIDMNAVVAGAEKMLRRLLISADVDLSTRLIPVGAPVCADSGQLEQVLMNLVVNARDAMPNGGALQIELSLVALDDADSSLHAGAPAGRYVVLAVSDTGTGMSEAVRRQIFDPFFTTKGAGQGTGLGLSTAYGIVKQSGGYIFVCSEPGEGTSFRIYLPHASPVPPAHSVGRSATPALGGPPVQEGTECVLLVDDEAPVRAAARRILERAGYDIIEAASGAEALQSVDRAAQPIDLVLTDMLMPEMSGRELITQLRAMRPELPVLMMSGYSSDPALRQSVSETGIRFLLKPFTPEGLTRHVREALVAR